jgi:hypothetical protein
MSIKVIDNFLNYEDYLLIYNELSSGDFPWFFGTVVLDDATKKIDDLYNFQFSHLFYSNYAPQSNKIDVLFPLIEKINPLSILRIKANLNTVTQNNIEHGFHCDYTKKTIKTAIYYLNTSDGYTLFENGQKINSVANRFVEFDAPTPHTGSTPTDTSGRIVINLNYFL